MGVAKEAAQWLRTAPMPTFPASVVNMSRRGGGFPVSSDVSTEQQGWRERHCLGSDAVGSLCVLPFLEEPWIGRPDIRGQPATDFGAALQATLFPAAAQTLFFRWPEHGACCPLES